MSEKSLILDSFSPNSVKTFGESIRLLREKNKLTLQVVASKLGIDTSMLGKLEKNTRKPTLLLIKKIAQVFEVSEKELIVNHLSDLICQILKGEEFADDVLLQAKNKLVYLKRENS